MYSEKESVGTPVVGAEGKGESGDGKWEVVLSGVQVQLVVGGGAVEVSVLRLFRSTAGGVRWKGAGRKRG